MSYISKINDKYHVVALDKNEIKIPEIIKQYFEDNFVIPVKINDPGVQDYYNWLQAVLPKGNYKLYRGLSIGGLGEKDVLKNLRQKKERLWPKDGLMSFSEKRSVAEEYAKDVTCGNYQYGMLISAQVPSDRIYFHHSYGNTRYQGEEEVLVYTEGMPYHIEKIIDPKGNLLKTTP